LPVENPKTVIPRLSSESVAWLRAHSEAFTPEAFELVEELDRLEVAPDDPRRLHQVLGDARSALWSASPGAGVRRTAALFDASLAISGWADAFARGATLSQKLAAVLRAWALAQLAEARGADPAD